MNRVALRSFGVTDSWRYHIQKSTGDKSINYNSIFLHLQNDKEYFINPLEKICVCYFGQYFVQFNRQK